MYGRRHDMEFLMEFIFELFGELIFDGLFALVDTIFPEKTLGKTAMKIIKVIIGIITAVFLFMLIIGVSLLIEANGVSGAGWILTGFSVFYLLMLITLQILKACGIISKNKEK